MNDHNKIQFLLLQLQASADILFLQLEAEKQTKGKAEKGVPVQPITVTRGNTTFTRWIDGNGWPAPNPEKKNSSSPTDDVWPTPKPKKEADTGILNNLVNSSLKFINSITDLITHADQLPKKIQSTIIDDTSIVINQISTGIGSLKDALSTEFAKRKKQISESGFGKAFENVKNSMTANAPAIASTAGMIAISVVPYLLGLGIMNATIMANTYALTTGSRIPLIATRVLGTTLISQGIRESVLKKRPSQNDVIKEMKERINPTPVDEKDMLDKLNIEGDLAKYVSKLNPSFLATFKELIANCDLSDKDSVKNFYSEMAKLQSAIINDLKSAKALEEKPDKEDNTAIKSVK